MLDWDREQQVIPAAPLPNTTGHTGPYPEVRKVEVNAAQAEAPLVAPNTVPVVPCGEHGVLPHATSSA